MPLCDKHKLPCGSESSAFLWLICLLFKPQLRCHLCSIPAWSRYTSYSESLAPSFTALSTENCLMCPPQSCEGHERGCHPVFDARSQPPAPCLARLGGALSLPPHLLSHQTFDLVTRHHLVVLFHVLQRLLDPRLVLPSQPVPLCLSQEEVQGHIRGLLGLCDIDLGSARSPCVHTVLGQRAQPVQQSPIARAAPRVTSGG